MSYRDGRRRFGRASFFLGFDCPVEARGEGGVTTFRKTRSNSSSVASASTCSAMSMKRFDCAGSSCGGGFDFRGMARMIRPPDSLARECFAKRHSQSSSGWFVQPLRMLSGPVSVNQNDLPHRDGRGHARYRGLAGLGFRRAERTYIAVHIIRARHRLHDIIRRRGIGWLDGAFPIKPIPILRTLRITYGRGQNAGCNG